MQRIENRWSQRAYRALAAIGVIALGCGTMPAFGQSASTAPSTPVVSAADASTQTPEVAAIRKAFEERFPGAHVNHIEKSNYFGLYEVMLDDNLIYTDPSAAYVFVGSVYDTATKQNLTEARSRKLNRVAVNKLPYDLAFKRVRGDGSRKLVIFSDADCPFCHRLEGEIKNLDNVTIYTFLFPIDQLHPNAAQKSKQIWCSADKAKAWDAFFTSGKLPDNKGDCGDPVARTQALGQSLHINATPTLIFADGTTIPGALPLPQIEKEMASAEIEAKKLAASAPAAK
ncbi:MAG TPA: DsbC family protein [Casimicrobiaceae bacterium]|nr:DsbC family protein [Casimicrobiaceae bacterium]